MKRMESGLVGTSAGQSSPAASQFVLIAASTGVIAASYGLVRQAYGLMLPEVQAELGLGTEAAGFIASGASIAYCIAAAIGLLLAARSSKVLVVGAALTAGLGAIGMALSPTVAMFAVFAVLSSTGSGFASPAIVNILQRNIAPGRVGPAQLIANAGSGPGLVLASILALVLLPNWRIAWGISGVIMLVACAIVLAYDRAGAGGVEIPRTVLSAQWFGAHGLLIVAVFLLGMGAGAVWTYARNLLVDAGADSSVSVLAWIALGLGGAIVILTARWTDRLSPRSAWTMAAVVTAFAISVFALLPTYPVVVIVSCVVFGWSYIVCCGDLILWTTQIDATRAPAGTAVLFIVLMLGQAAGAGIAGSIAVAAGYLAAFLVAAVLTLAAAFVVYLKK